MLWGWSSLTIAGSISFLIIWPKVARVRSGERVVVSKLLGSRFSSSTSETASAGADHSDTHGDPTHANTNGDHTHGLAPSASEEPKTRRRITATDAIPSRVEKKVFEVQGLLKNILKKRYVECSQTAKTETDLLFSCRVDLFSPRLCLL